MTLPAISMCSIQYTHLLTPRWEQITKLPSSWPEQMFHKPVQIGGLEIKYIFVEWVLAPVYSW